MAVAAHIDDLVHFEIRDVENYNKGFEAGYTDVSDDAKFACLNVPDYYYRNILFTNADYALGMKDGIDEGFKEAL